MPGQDIRHPSIDEVTGKPLYDKMKGTFVWELDVRPTLLHHDGMWKRMMVGVNDTCQSWRTGSNV